MKKVLCLTIALVITLCGCIRDKKYMNSEADNYVVCSFGELPASLNTVDSNSQYYNGIFTYLFEGLVTSDRGGNINEGLAKDWTLSSDGISYSFEIREDARWSDGAKVSAADFVKFFKYILSKAAENPSAKYLFSIFGAEDYSKGKVKFDGVAIRALNESTLEIRLNKADTNFLKELSKPDFVLRKDFEALKAWKDNYKDLLYTGPFIVESIDEKGVALAKNEDYWDSSYVTDEKFLLLEGKSPESALADFEVNKINIMRNPPISEMERIISNDNTIIINSQNIVALSFNSKNSSILRDMTIRKKIAESIKPEELAKTCLGAFKPEEYDLFKPVEAFNSVEKELQDKEKANKEETVDEKEEAVKDEKLFLKLLVVNNDINKRLSKGIKKQLEENLNCKVSLKYIMKEEIKTEVDGGSYDILLEEVTSGFNEASFQNCEIMPLFNNVEIVIKSDFIQGLEIDPYQYVILKEIVQR